MPDNPPDNASLHESWARVTELLRRSVPTPTFDHWFAPLQPQSLSGTTLSLSGPAHICTWVERRYPELLVAAIRGAGLEVRTVRFIAADTPDRTEISEAPAGRAAPSPTASFDNFVIGSTNQVAHAAALAVAEAPGQAYNPLFLHGRPGLGKTHLMAAIGNYLRAHSPELKSRYTTAEQFANEFVYALQAGEMSRFKRGYRQVDVLLIDDVQFLQGKTRTSEELFHTFNDLFAAGSQVVLSADRMPSDLSALADRLRDRFEWGMIADIGEPDDATRLAVLRLLGDQRGEQITDAAAEAVLQRSGPNPRAIEGALTRVIAMASLTGAEIDAGLVEKALPRRFSPSAPAPARPTLEQVQDAVCTRLEVSREDLVSAGRTAPVAKARQLAMFLSRQLTDLSLPAIARGHGRSDHTTVMYAVQQVERKRSADAGLAALIDELTSQLSGDQTGRDRS